MCRMNYRLPSPPLAPSPRSLPTTLAYYRRGSIRVEFADVVGAHPDGIRDLSQEEKLSLTNKELNLPPDRFGC